MAEAADIQEDMEEANETFQNEGKSTEMKQMDFLKQFIILGVSRFSDTSLIIEAVDVLNTILNSSQKVNIVDDIIYMILEVSEKGRCINQNALFLCLVMCYMHGSQGKRAICDQINRLCRIPTHLFLFLKMLKAYIERGATQTDIVNTAEFYNFVLKGHSSSEVEIKKIKNATFIAKHKFIAQWYSDVNKSAQDLLLLMTKYQNREGWNHQTLLRYCHVKISKEDEFQEYKNIVIEYILKGFKNFEKEHGCIKDMKKMNQVESRIYQYIDNFEDIKKATNDKDPAVKIAELIEKFKRHPEDVFRDNAPLQFAFPGYHTLSSVEMLDEPASVRSSRLHLVLEHLPTTMYREARVWYELIKDMPMTAMLRHVCHMSYLGLFTNEDHVTIIREALTNKSRLYPFIHPLQVLKTLVAYLKGKSGMKKEKEKSWDVNPQICGILEEAFLLSIHRDSDGISFENCVICIDDSLSMHQNGYLGFENFTATMVAVAVASAVEKSGTGNNIVLCGQDTKVLEKNMGLLELLKESALCKDEKANLSQPIREAISNKKYVNAFIIFTKSIQDNVYGESPYEVYKEYRSVMTGVHTKLLICAMEAHSNIMADLDDPTVHIHCGGDANLLCNMKISVKGYY